MHSDRIVYRQKLCNYAIKLELSLTEHHPFNCKLQICAPILGPTSSNYYIIGGVWCLRPRVTHGFSVMLLLNSVSTEVGGLDTLISPPVLGKWMITFSTALKTLRRLFLEILAISESEYPLRISSAKREGNLDTSSRPRGTLEHRDCG